MKHQQGNALFLILIAVALFAALSYAITQSGRSGGSIDKEMAMIAAGQIPNYPNEIKNMITRMQLTGSPLADISFAYNGLAIPTEQGDYQNKYTYYNDDPTNEIFNPAGGNVKWQEPNPQWCLNDACGNTFTGQWEWFIGSNTTTGKKMLGVGTANADTIAVLGNLKLNVCNAINTQLGLSTPPAQDNNGTETFEAYPGEEVFCMELTPGTYRYYHTLVAY